MRMNLVKIVIYIYYKFERNISKYIKFPIKKYIIENVENN